MTSFLRSWFDAGGPTGHADRGMAGIAVEGSAKTILVVEDDAAISGIVTKTLESSGYVTHAVFDGDGALPRAIEVSPDAIILDVNLPNVDGFRVAKQLKARADTKSIPIIFLTAQDGPMNVISGIQAGAKHYLTKPFKLPDLLEKVAKLFK